MADRPNPAVQAVASVVADHMDDILKLFKPGAKFAVLVYRPEVADGSQDFLLSNDTVDSAIAALQQRKSQPTITGDV